ncbi:MAG: PQQ-binding-like beta-propeller repeat protein [Planctomycetota bacterium]
MLASPPDHSDVLLSEAELEFLLEEQAATLASVHQTESPWGTEPDSVSLSGDLQDHDIREVLESLIDSEGVLRVSNPIEEHLLYIHDGVVQNVVPQRMEQRRLGHRLVRAGIINQLQLEHAIAAQRQSNMPLGRMLVDERLVSEAELAQHLSEQIAEDILSLFTWPFGRFEFAAGTPSEAQQDLFAEQSALDLREVLDEAEGHADEWAAILQAFGNDGLVVPRRKETGVDVPPEYEKVLGAIDGERSLHDLPNATTLGLFDCARAVKKFYEWKLVDTAQPAELLSIARGRVVRGELRPAVMILRSLMGCDEVREAAFARDVASLLQRCGEQRMAAVVLVRSAQETDYEQDALELAREAYAADPRTFEVLQFLHERLSGPSDPGDELYEVTCAYSDALMRQRKFDEALEVITPIAQASPENLSAFGRRVRLLRRLDDDQQAVEELLSLAECYEHMGDLARQATVYENILRIDSSRDDLARVVKRIRAKPVSRRLRLAQVGTVLAIVTLAGAWWLTTHLSDSRQDELVGQVSALLDDKNAAAATAMLDANPEYAGSPQIQALQDRLSRLRTAQANEVRASREHIVQQLGAADRAFGRSDLKAALTIYQEVMGSAKHKAEAIRAAQRRLTRLAEQMEKRVQQYAVSLPPAPSDRLEAEAQVQTVLARLLQDFPAADLLDAEAVIAVRDEPLLKELLGEEPHQHLLRVAEEVRTLFASAETRREQYTALKEVIEKKGDLEPVWGEAQRFEAAHRYREALAAYTRLAAEYPVAGDELKIHFEERRDRCQEIVDHLDAVSIATERGDSDAARATLLLLRRFDRDIEWAQLITLPVRIETIPLGAQVRVNGQPVGETPLTTAYRPEPASTIEVSLPGFEAREWTLEGENTKVLQALLSKEIEWTAELPGVVERGIAFRKTAGDSAGEAFVVDRSGNINAFDLGTGTRLWSRETGDLSGLLSTPLVWHNRLIVGSVDGSLRCINIDNARTAWEEPGYPCEAGAVLIEGNLLIGTVDRRIVCFDPATGARRYEVKAAGPIRSDLQAAGDRVVLVTTDGWLQCLSAADGAEQWRTRVGDDVLAAPRVAGDVVLAVDTGGRLLAVRLTDGKQLWDRHGLGYLEFTPAICDGHVAVATDERLLMFALSDGKRGPLFRWRRSWSSAPCVADGRLLVGDLNGMIAVLDTDDLELQYVIRGTARTSAPPAVSPEGRAILAFEDRTLFSVEKLP